MQMQYTDQMAGPDGGLSVMGQRMDMLDRFFTVIFAFELALNMFAQWFWNFWDDGWNW